MDTKDLTIAKARHLLDDKHISAGELRQFYSDAIKRDNPTLNAYLSVFETPLENPKMLNLAPGLDGIPCAIKDNILVRDLKCTAGSKILENYIASYDATVIDRLKSAGASMLGKTNLDEFAMGTSGENSAFGPTRNPHDHTRAAGGSSSGSAAAVAGGLAMFALGSDTGGSIRCPAAYCGVVGFKPTYGRVSRHGIVAMASSLDQIGPITRTVEDAAIVLQSIAGNDPFDSTTASQAVPDYRSAIGQSIEGLKIAVPREFFLEGLDSRIRISVEKAIAKLQSLGAHVDEVSLPMTDYALATYYIIVPSEVSSNLARFDGVRYGLSVNDKSGALLDTYLDSRAQGFGEEVRRRIILGTFVLSAGYYDAYYIKAQKVRTLIRRDFDAIFDKYDVVVGPTTPTLATKLGAVSDPLAMYLADIYTVQANLAGLPSLSMPCGMIEEDGASLPVGFQIMGQRFDEAMVLRVGHALEKAL